MKKFAVIVAGGTGTRMGSSLPKQFLPLHGRTVLWYSLEAFLQSYNDIQIILVLPGDHLDNGKTIIETTSDPKRISVVQGGETRFHSVKNGLKLVDNSSMVFVHDAVRCLVTIDLIHHCYEAALEKGNAIPAVEAIDSMRILAGSGNEIIDRSLVRIIQTPQTFYSYQLKQAFELGYQPEFTDEASVAEKSGIKINLVAGEATNTKITQPIDLIIAERILKDRYS